MARIKGTTVRAPGKQAEPKTEADVQNDATLWHYYSRIMEIAVTRFEWNNLPASVDARYLEMALFYDGHAVFFEDEVMGPLALRCAAGGVLDVYGVPQTRVVNAFNGYYRELDDSNSVMVYNDFLRNGTMEKCLFFARKMAEVARTMDVNIRAQKTPVLIKGTQTQVAALKRMYRDYDGNQPALFVDAAQGMDVDTFGVCSTGAPYVADKCQELLTQYWNEALTMLGVANVGFEKRERLLSDEVNRSLGGAIMSRYSPLAMRQQAAERINEKFGLNVGVEFRADFRALDDSIDPDMDSHAMESEGEVEDE